MVGNDATVPNDFVSEGLGLAKLIVVVVVKHDTIVAVLFAWVEPGTDEFGAVLGTLEATDGRVSGSLGDLPFEEGLELGVLILSDPETKERCHQLVVSDLLGIDSRGICHWESLVFLKECVTSLDQLDETLTGFRLFGLLDCFVIHREAEGGQNGDDRDHDEEFDKREAASFGRRWECVFHGVLFVLGILLVTIR